MLPIDELTLQPALWRLGAAHLLGWADVGGARRLSPPRDARGALEARVRNDDTITMRMPPGGRFFDQVPGERQDTFEIPHMTRIRVGL